MKKNQPSAHALCMSPKLFHQLIFSVLVAFNTTTVLAQREADCTINGSCFQVMNIGCEPPFANAILKFNDDSLESIIEPLNLNLSTGYSRAAFSDKHTGDLIFASNGWRLVNRSGEILADKLWFDSMPHPHDSPDTTNVLNYLGPLFLNDPGDSTKAYLLYGQYQEGVTPNSAHIRMDTWFTYAYLDIPSQTMISKNNVILDVPSTTGDMQACRHANGRDWWIVKPSINENRYFIGLLDPTGIHMEEVMVEGVTSSEQANMFSYFSHDGLKYLHFTGRKYLQEFDFDRCTGTLSNPVIHNLRDSLKIGDFNACTISADGSKFYFRRSLSPLSPPPPLSWGEGILQYDLNTNIFTYLTEFSSAPFLTPNGKEVLLQSRIIVDSTTQIRTLSVIKSPNEPGLACNLELHKYIIQNNTSFVSPSNYANFRLGALTGSGCDTLVLNTVYSGKGINSGSIHMYPNPAKTSITVECKEAGKTQVMFRLFNNLGQLKLQKYISAETEFITEIEGLPAGLYFIQLIGKDGKMRKVEKLVVER